MIPTPNEPRTYKPARGRATNGEMQPVELQAAEVLATDPAPAPARAALPTDLPSMLEHAETLLAERTRLYGALAQTHELIPHTLRHKLRCRADLAAAELAGGETLSEVADLAQAELDRLRLVRQRQGSLAGLLAQADDLTEARGQLERALQTHARGVVADFATRYEAGVKYLQQLWREADLLSTALRVTVDTPLPCRIDGLAPELTDEQQQLAHIRPSGVPTLAKIYDEGAPEPAADQLAVRVGACLDGLDAAVTFAQAVVHTQRSEGSLYIRSNPRGGAFDSSALFDVRKTFISNVDSLPFHPGQIIDVSLCSPIALQRMLSVKTVTTRYDHALPVARGETQIPSY